MIITYHSSVSILHNTFQCYLSVEEMKSEIECEECAGKEQISIAFPKFNLFSRLQRLINLNFQVVT